MQRPHRVHGEFASNQVRLDLGVVELEGYIILFPSCFIVSLYLPSFWSIEFEVLLHLSLATIEGTKTDFWKSSKGGRGVIFSPKNYITDCGPL